ncbi:MAG: hypothetical protein ACI9BW_003770 [Gammaproteobacteria bacterium]|jgi:hypothetical protein
MSSTLTQHACCHSVFDPDVCRYSCTRSITQVVAAACTETRLPLSEVPDKILAAAAKAVSQIELEEASLIGESVYVLEG